MIKLSEFEEQVLQKLLVGLDLVAHPYQVLAEQLGTNEDKILSAIRRLDKYGVLKRFGAVVKHEQLGFTENAMVVWQIEPTRLSTVGRLMGKLPWIRLCYSRKHYNSAWPYNLYCMVFAKDRSSVYEFVQKTRVDLQLENVSYKILFRQNTHKQCAGQYIAIDENKFAPTVSDGPYGS